MIKPVMICAKRRASQILRRQASQCIEQAPAAFTKLATHCCQPLHAPSDASRPRHKTPQDVTNTSIDSGISPPPPAAATARCRTPRQALSAAFTSAALERRWKHRPRVRRSSVPPGGRTTAEISKRRVKAPIEWVSAAVLLISIDAARLDAGRRLTRLASLSRNVATGCPTALSRAFDPISLVAANRNAPEHHSELRQFGADNVTRRWSRRKRQRETLAWRRLIHGKPP